MVTFLAAWSRLSFPFAVGEISMEGFCERPETQLSWWAFGSLFDYWAFLASSLPIALGIFEIPYLHAD